MSCYDLLSKRSKLNLYRGTTQLGDYFLLRAAALQMYADLRLPMQEMEHPRKM